VITNSLSAKLPGVGVHVSGGSVSLSTAGAGLTAMGSSVTSGGEITLAIDLRGATIANQQAMNQLADTIGKAVVKKLAPAGVHIHS